MFQHQRLEVRQRLEVHLLSVVPQHLVVHPRLVQAVHLRVVSEVLLPSVPLLHSAAVVVVVVYSVAEGVVRDLYLVVEVGVVELCLHLEVLQVRPGMLRHLGLLQLPHRLLHLVVLVEEDKIAAALHRKITYYYEGVVSGSPIFFVVQS